MPENVEISIEGSVLKAKGPKGELAVPFEPEYVSFEKNENELVVTRANDTKPARARHGLYRSLAANAVQGVAEGFSKTLEIKGVGYRVALKGTTLEFNLGYSHPIKFPLPESLTCDFKKENPNILTISGIDKQLVGQVTANIRALRKPEPYKGKGIRYIDEHVVRKAGKSAAKK